MDETTRAVRTYCAHTKSKFIRYSNLSARYVFENKEGVIHSFTQPQLLEMVRSMKGGELLSEQ